MLVTQEAEEVEKQGGQLNKRMIAVLCALAVHVVGGAGALFYSMMSDTRHEPEIFAHVIAPQAEQKKQIEKKEVKKQAEQAVSQAAPPPIAQLLRANTSAMTSAPTLMAIPDSPIGLGEGNLAVGFGGRAGGGMGKGAVFFGTNVQGRLGVVFDVSGSMHEYVPIVVDEINAKFRTALVVCVNSSALSVAMGEPKVVPYLDGDSTNTLKPLLFTDVAKQMDRDLAGLPNCFFIHKDGNTLGHGVEYLISEGITNVFVFSDFHDAYNGAYIEKLTETAAKSKVKVHLQVLDELGIFNMGREPYLQGLAAKTGGVYAVGALLDRANR